MAGRVAVLAGASGLVGAALLRLLLLDAAFERVIALARRPLPLAQPKLDVRIVDFPALPAISATDAFCCLGTTIRKAGSQAAFRQVDHDHVVAFARAARDGGAAGFLLVSSVGADAQAGNFYLRVKGETEDSVAAIGFPGLDIMRPSLLLGPRPERRPTEALAQVLMLLANPLLPIKYRAIDHALVARAMLAAAHLPAEPRRVLHVADIRKLAAGQA
jgi:uncharacterized protein YbjT (DUF2867 family)